MLVLVQLYIVVEYYILLVAILNKRVTCLLDSKKCIVMHVVEFSTSLMKSDKEMLKIFV